VWARVVAWFDERLDITQIWRALFLRKMPKGLNWWYTLGSATLFLFVIQVVTGIFLAMYYSPTPDHAYDSINYIMNDVAFGPIVRGLHHWSASLMIIMVVLHMLRTFAMGAYKYPREATWSVGVLLLILVLGFAFTGYLLPWDQKAYWATVVGTSIAGSAPVVGNFILRVVRGTSDVGAVTLARFYSTHIFLLPLLLGGLIVVHLFMVIRQGISAPPELMQEEPGDGDPKDA
jgi:quinol-cytochrome oxidoreductase complex cytochrome b subunit